MDELPYIFDALEKTIHLTDGDPRKPLLLLLHGTGDTEIAWRRPESHPNRNFDYTAPFPADRTLGWRAYPGVGVWSFELDPLKDVTSWLDIFEVHRFRTVRYSQVDNTGLLARPVRELETVMDTLHRTFPDDRIVVLTQSRGGILIRKFIKDNFADKSRVGCITKVITLHTSHDGSRLANIAASLTALIQDLRTTFPAPLVDGALGWLDDLVNLPAFQELRVGGPFLAELSDGEQPLPEVEYHTFGGTSVRATRARSWVYTLGSAVPQWHLPPFDHRITMIEVPVISPLLDSLPNLTEEITEGKGDILVAEQRSHLPWSVRRTNAINHAETYWDPGLQSQVLRILGEELTVWS